jgi:hypothetical protein
VAENNAIADTPALAVTVIGARARRRSVIPLPNTANARQQQQHPPHRPGHPATGGQHVQTPHPRHYQHRPSDTGSNTGQLRSCARDCSNRFGERLAAIAASVSGGVTHALPLFPQDNVFPEDNVASSIAVTPVLAPAEVL